MSQAGESRKGLGRICPSLQSLANAKSPSLLQYYRLDLEPNDSRQRW